MDLISQLLSINLMLIFTSMIKTKSSRKNMEGRKILFCNTIMIISEEEHNRILKKDQKYLKNRHMIKYLDLM